MKNVIILGKDYTVQDQKSEKDSIQQKEDMILIESNTKTPKTLLNEHLTELLYTQLSKIYEEVKSMGKIEVFGDLDFEIVDKIDKKKERIAKLKGERILVKINAVTLPEEALKYVIAHEIAHTLTKRHTRRFWKIMEVIHPNYKEAQNLLIKYLEILSTPLK